ncbi:hypothetical protein [Owenweeksia hongkongensis]|uniref:hypothetical protein n=1 Tax=Owenweeksia hongkongensis TaxID=253245 RepID=UPI003A8F2B52
MKIVRNILAVIVGWAIGSAVNMGLINAGHSVFPLEGVDPSDMEALAAAMPNASAEHFIFPFLAHALGTLVGALIAALIAATHKMKFAYAIGALFLIGGIMVSFMIPSPTWFIVLDIALAYIPMAWIGGKIGMSINKT